MAGGLLADSCASSAVWQHYPHGQLSEAPDCTYTTHPCAQKFDVGSWSAQGLGGQLILGHPGLDMVILAKDCCGPVLLRGDDAVTRPPAAAADAGIAIAADGGAGVGVVVTVKPTDCGAASSSMPRARVASRPMTSSGKTAHAAHGGRSASRPIR
jgi:hypothetical protein